MVAVRPFTENGDSTLFDKQIAARWLRQVTENGGVRGLVTINALSVLGALVTELMVGGDDLDDMRVDVAVVLINCSLYPTVRATLHRIGACKSIVELLGRGQSRARDLALACLQNLTLLPATHVDLLSAGLFTQLQRLFGGEQHAAGEGGLRPRPPPPSLRTRQRALTVLQHLTSVSSNVPLLLQANIVPMLLADLRMQPNEEEGRVRALGCMLNLSAAEPAHAHFTHRVVLRDLMDLRRQHGSAEIEQRVVQVLHNVRGRQGSR